MKEATEFGIKILDPESGRLEMFGDLYKTLQECERTIELFKKTSIGRHVELFPVEIRDLASQEQPQDHPEVKEGKAEEPLPEPDIRKDIHREVYKSNPDGTVDVEIDGKKVTDPEKQKEAKERLDHMFDHILDDWPWFRDLNKRGIDPPSKQTPVQEPWDPNQFPYPGWPIWLWDPRQAPWYSTGFSTSNGKDLQPNQSHRSIATC